MAVTSLLLLIVVQRSSNTENRKYLYWACNKPIATSSPGLEHGIKCWIFLIAYLF